MQLGRKIYFDKITGNVLVDTGERMGSVRETTVEEDFQIYQTLAERVPETVDMIQLWFGQFAQDFAECNGYRVNPETKELEFSYPDPNEPPEEQRIAYRKPLSKEVVDIKQAIAELTILLAGGM